MAEGAPVRLMPELRSTDGRYAFVLQSDGNEVLYETTSMLPVWDRWSWEAGHAPAPGFVTHTKPDPAWPAWPTGDALPSTGSARVIQVTAAQDGELLNRGYSYWPSVWITAANTAICFVGHDDGRVRFFKVDLDTGIVRRLGPMLSYRGTGEGWWFTAAGEIVLCDGPRLRRVNPFTGEETVLFDISETHPGCRIWQAHSDDAGVTHSATVQAITNDGPYLDLGTVLVRDGQQQFFDAQGAYVLDESALTPDGAFLIIKTKPDDDNLVVTLATGEQRWLRKSQGSLGHSDCGPGHMVGADRDHEPRACVKWDLTKPLTPENRRLLSSQPDWSGGDFGHVSIRNGVCIVSDGRYIRRVALDGSGETILCAHGMVIPPGTRPEDEYDFQVFGSLDPTGQWALFMSNRDGRMDAFLLRLP